MNTVIKTWFDEDTESQSSPLIAAKIADILREEILTSEDGAFLGSEEELLQRFKVSRPTFRQTSRLLEQEQILVVKRGLGGGYFARKPGIGVVSRATATYLRSRGINSRQLSDASRSAFRSLVRSAALSNNEEGLEQLAAIRTKFIAVDVEETDGVEMHNLDMEFGTCIGMLAANPALELFLSGLYYTALQQQLQQSVTLRIVERRVEWRRLRIRLTDAILAREPEVAEALALRANDAVLEWRTEDDTLAEGKKSKTDALVP